MVSTTLGRDYRGKRTCPSFSSLSLKNGSCKSSESGAELELDVELDPLVTFFPLDFGVLVLRINLTGPPTLVSFKKVLLFLGRSGSSLCLEFSLSLSCPRFLVGAC